MRKGTLVRVSADYGDPYLRGRIGTVRRQYGGRSYTAFEVEFEKGESKLFWHHEVEEAEEFYQQSR
jgi:hypothetical protein